MARIVKTPEERKKEIISTAKSLFLEKGYDNTQINDITNAMGVAHGLVYHYFESKEVIFEAVAAEWASEYLSEVIAVLNDSTINAMDKLEKVFRCIHQKTVMYLSIAKEIHLSHNAELHNKMSLSGIRLILPYVQKVIIEGNAEGSFHCPYPEETAIFLLYGSKAIDFSDDVEGLLKMIKSMCWRLFGISGSQ